MDFETKYRLVVRYLLSSYKFDPMDFETIKEVGVFDDSGKYKFDPMDFETICSARPFFKEA